MIIKDFRKKLGLSIRGMAKEINCSPTYLNDIEHGYRKITPAIINSFVTKYYNSLSFDMISELITDCYSEEIVNRYLDTEINSNDMYRNSTVGIDVVRNLLTQRFFYIMTGIKEFK